MHTIPQSILLIGKVGSGKGTQAALLRERFGYSIFSTGNKVREHALKKTPFGKRIKAAYEEGMLIPEWVASYWLTHEFLVERSLEGVVLEGACRKPKEARLFHKIHSWLDRSYIVVQLDIPDTLAYQRSAGRGRDALDAHTLVERRLDEYYKYTERSLVVFKEYGTLVRIDADKDPDAVHADILQVIETKT